MVGTLDEKPIKALFQNMSMVFYVNQQKYRFEYRGSPYIMEYQVGQRCCILWVNYIPELVMWHMDEVIEVHNAVLDAVYDRRRSKSSPRQSTK